MTANRHMIDKQTDGEWLQARPGEYLLIRIAASATNGSYAVTEIVSSPGDSTPVHVHEKEDEHVLMVEGTARVLYGDRTFDAVAGTMVSHMYFPQQYADSGLKVFRDIEKRNSSMDLESR